MKSLVVILFISAGILFVSGVFVCCIRIKNKAFSNSGVWLIITGVLKAVCGLIAISDPVFSIISIIVGLAVISAAKYLLDN